MVMVWIAQLEIPPRAMGRQKSTSVVSKFWHTVGGFWHRRKMGNCHLWCKWNFTMAGNRHFQILQIIPVVFKERSTKSFSQYGTYSGDLHSLVNGITDPCARRLWINNLFMLSFLQEGSVVSWFICQMISFTWLCGVLIIQLYAAWRTSKKLMVELCSPKCCSPSFC